MLLIAIISTVLAVNSENRVLGLVSYDRVWLWGRAFAWGDPDFSAIAAYDA
ncbi:MAG: hypothetical protein ACR5K7_06205 [Symbiopectobacterium sp.]